MKTKLVNRTVKSYLAELAAKKPAPGGGSAAALCGCLGVSLITMAAEYTKAAKEVNGYKKMAAVVVKKSKQINLNLLKLIDEDARVYEKLSKRFKISGADSKLTQSALKEAVIAPLRICDCVYGAALLSLDMAFAGRKYLMSDIEVAVHMIDAAFDSAGANIAINLKLVNDKKFMKSVMDNYNVKYLGLKKIKAKVLSKVKERTAP